MSLDLQNDADCKEAAAILNSALQYDPELLERPAYALSDSLKASLVKDNLDKLPNVLSDQQASEILHSVMATIPDLQSTELLDRKAQLLQQVNTLLLSDPKN